MTPRDDSSEGATLALPGALRLFAWLSPSFPIGAYSYSHGLERAVELSLVRDEESLEAWLHELLRFGSGRSEALLFGQAWRRAPSVEAFVELAELAAALRPSAELARESEAQGEAFVRTVLAAWPEPALARLVDALLGAEVPPSLAVMAGAASRLAGVPLVPAAGLFVHAVAANWISAGVRLIPLGQTAGQRLTAGCEELAASLAREASSATLEEIGSAVPAAEILSMQHEGQYTRLFRS